MKLKINDTIKVLSGDDKGRTGKVLKLFVAKNAVLVEGLNLYKRHLKTQGQQQGGIVSIERPIRVTKVAVVCPHCQKTTRIKYTGQGHDKIRICRHCQKPLTTDVKKPQLKKK